MPYQKSTSDKLRIVIIGAGFAGLNLAKSLRNSEFDVLLLDRQNYHTFQPLLYQVATGGLEPDSIAYPVRRIFRHIDNVRFQMAEVESIDFLKSQLKSSVGLISYDKLVIATGSTTEYFNFEPVRNYLFPLKSVPDALNIRSFLMQNLEQAVATFDPKERSELINVAVIGGGPAGVELSGALAEMKRYVLPKDFPQIDFSAMTIRLFEAGDRLLPMMKLSASQKSLVDLQRLGVEVNLNTRVLNYDNHKLNTDTGDHFHADTVIWTAGVKGNPVAGFNEKVITPGQRLRVDAGFKIEGMSEVYAIGDVAAQTNSLLPKGHPMLATVAIQQGEYLADTFLSELQGKKNSPFKYRSPGVMATIGRNKAVAEIWGLQLKGTFAWLVWMFVHVLSLAGFRNKLVTLVGWTLSYFNYDRPLGLIIRPYRKRTAMKKPDNKKPKN